MVRVSNTRMSGTAEETVVLHVAPEATAGRPLALVRDGDEIALGCRCEPGGVGAFDRTPGVDARDRAGGGAVPVDVVAVAGFAAPVGVMHGASPGGQPAHLSWREIDVATARPGRERPRTSRSTCRTDSKPGDSCLYIRGLVNEAVATYDMAPPCSPFAIAERQETRRAQKRSTNPGKQRLPCPRLLVVDRYFGIFADEGSTNPCVTLARTVAMSSSRFRY